MLNYAATALEPIVCNVTVPSGSQVVGVKLGVKGPGNASSWGLGIGREHHSVVPGSFATVWLTTPISIDVDSAIAAAHHPAPPAGGAAASGLIPPAALGGNGMRTYMYRGAVVPVTLQPVAALPPSFPTWVTFVSVIMQRTVAA